MNIREVRLARLQELLAAVGNKQAELARRIKTSPSQLNQWLSGNRTITEDSARKIESAAGKARGWMDIMDTAALVDAFTQGSPTKFAGSIDELPATYGYPTTIEWGDLAMDQLPDSFGLVLPDDSMAPDLPTGALVWFERDLTPRAPDWVLLTDDTGNWYVREYKERRPGHWEAHAINQAYLPLDSIRDGLRVAAVYVGMKARRG